MYTAICEASDTDYRETRGFLTLGPAMHFAMGALSRLGADRVKLRIENREKQVVFGHEQILDTFQQLKSYEHA